MTLLALEVTRLLVYKLHVSLDVVLPGEPVPTQLTPELFEAQVSPQVRSVGLLLQFLVALWALNKHHVTISQHLGNTESLAQQRIKICCILVASENYKRFLSRFIAAASCLIEVRNTFSQVGFSGPRSWLGLFQGVLLSHSEDNFNLRLAVCHGWSYESFLHWI